MKKKGMVLFTTLALVGALLAISGCSSAQPASSTSNTPESSSSTEAAARAESATASETEETAPAQTTSATSMLSLAEYGEQYPLQTESWLKISEDGICMGAMHDRFMGTLGAAFGMDGIPLYCGSCHNANYKTLLEERGPENMLVTDSTAGIEVEYMGCGVCHSEDLTAGVSANTSFWPTFISEASWNKYINQDDTVCGQCHMLEPGSVYMLPEYAGSVDIYKYGVDADSVLQAQLEAWDENPIELTQVMLDNAFQVGASRIDEETGALIIGDNNKPILETFQGSNHQKLGLTCTDCHMVEMTAENGTTYTNHFACDPLENETTLEFCLTCHKAQGQTTTADMKTFVEDRQAELSAAQKAFHADTDALHDLLVAATNNGGVDENVLASARDAYTRGIFYYHYQAQLTSINADEGVTAAHNPENTYAVIEKGETLVQDAIKTLQDAGIKATDSAKAA